MGRKDSKKKNKVKTKPGQPGGLKGALEITRSGIGYVVIPDGSGDILVRPGDFNTALNGDTVRVRVVKENIGSGRKEGKITEVVQRKQTEFIGTLQMATNFAFFVPDTDKPMPDLYIPLENLHGALHKQRVAVRLVKWDKDDKKPVGEVISILQEGDENDVAMKEILAEAGFPLSFPDKVMEEAARLPDIISQSEINKRKDFRDILTFTIDPIDAKDFDDALSIRLLKNGLYEIGVHIADVSHYVEPDTVLDEEAYKRATSVYLPDRVNPMLPEHISNVLCSLRPREDKLTFSAIFQMDIKGKVKQYWLGKTIIHSDHRFTYEEVQDVIEKGGSDSPYSDELLLLNNIAQKLRKQRFSKGAINFSSQEVRFQLDEEAKPIGIVVKESKEANQLIEEFMLLANRTVAENVSKIKVNKKNIPFPYRIHDQPDEQKLLPFITFAKKYGHKFDISSPEKIAQSFNQMLDDVEGKPEQHVLEQLGIRTMAKAVYSTENIGHYGLAFEFYCHFTSPIRRYPDVMVHRVLESILHEKPMIDKKMDEKCKHSSERERAAMEAERASNKYKQVEFMRNYLGETFEGVISGVASFGFWVETIDYKCEGLVSIASLSDYDDFRSVEGDYSLVGLRSGRKFRMGDKVTIRVVAANLDKRQLDYEWVLRPDEESEDAKKVPAKKAARKKAAEKAPAKKKAAAATKKAPAKKSKKES
ncbi:ribonuclease R [Danxiaibacter flavus]|uniref:Ribonuclease R n=1 Tax=Danxiaibacter flavus TaxID=3049108 RepID=A0ABV3ZCE8_9BACT|nr:ribonuclease R [Chitinophagaceae bacterium DXS]